MSMALTGTERPSTATRPLNRDLRKPGLIGLAGLAVMVGVLGFWAATTVIGGAVIASGQAMVQGDAKVVQSLDGGMIESIAVANGDTVQAGDVLMRLDPTLVAINLDIAQSRLAAAMALRARLQAEQLRLDTLVFAYDPLPFAAPDTALHEASQIEIFRARLAVLQGGREQLLEANAQFETRQIGMAGQITATQAQIDLIGVDLENLRGLVEQGLARQSQLTELQRAEAELRGRLAGLEAELAQLSTASREAELRTLQTERAFMESVVTELRDATAEVEEMTLEIVTRTAQLDRIDIRAPVTGVVHEMQITTEGGIVAAGAPILEVIPQGGEMVFHVRVDPHAVDQVWRGQGARVIIASFDPQTTPQLEASVTQISPDVITDPVTGQQYYRVDLTVPPSEIDRLGAVDLMSGMPVEAYLETGDRTVLAYLLQPLTAHLRRTFRE